MSVFKQMIELRDSFVDRYSNNTEVINWLKDGTRPTLRRCETSILGQNYLLHFNDNSECAVMKDTGEITDRFTYDEFGNVMTDSLLGAEEYSVKDVFIKVGESTAVYETLSQLTTKFSYTNRVRLSDVVNYLNDQGDLDLSTFKNDLFLIADKEGFITMPSFIKCIDSYMKQAKEATDDESLALDETNPFTLQNILNIAVQAVSSAVSAMCTALSAVFGGFMVLIGLIVSIITKLWGALQTFGEYSYDPTASSSFILGPPVFIDGFKDDLSYVASDIAHDRNVRYWEENGLGSFVWWNDDYSDFKMNSYLYPHFKPYEAVKYLVDHNYLVFTGDGLSASTIKFNSVRLMGQVISSGNIPSYDSDGSTPKSSLEAMASVALTWILLSIYGWYKAKYYDSSSDRELWLQAFFNHTTPSGANDEQLMFRACQLIEQAWVFGNSSADAFYKCIDDGKYDAHFAKALTAYLSADLIPNGGKFLGRASNINDVVVLGTSMGSSSAMPLLYSLSFLSGLIKTEVDSSINLTCQITKSRWLSGYLADCLPQSFAITLPEVDTDAISRVLLAISEIVIAAVITLTPLSISMKMKKAGKTALRSADLNKKREDFINDPTNAALELDYEREALKFDTFGKIFGWGSYDAANGWINAPSTSGSSLVSNFASSYSASQRSAIENENLLIAIKNLLKAD